MSIDLSKAKIGDKFRTRNGRILEYKGKSDVMIADNYLFDDKEERRTILFFRNGSYMLRYKHELDLIAQVFDKGDLLDNNIGVEERWQALVEMAKSEREEAKEFGVVIQNLPHIVEQLKEDNPELQRRQEVIALAEKLVVNEEMMKAHKDLFEAEVHAHAKTQTTYPAFVIRSAEDFIKYKTNT